MKDSIELFKDNKKLITYCFVIIIIASVPWMSVLIYGYDDYYLYYLYDINMETLGYNFYAYGRRIEGLLADLFHSVNLSPITRPMGIILFQFANVLLGTYFVDKFKVKNNILKCILVLLFSTNCFMNEILYYSIVPVFSSVAILFLLMSLMLLDRYFDSHKIGFVVLSIMFSILSCYVYQIFYTIAIAYALFRTLMSRDLKQLKEHIIRVIILGSSVVLYYIVLNISFSINPPAIEMPQNNIIDTIKSMFSSEYWENIMNIYNIFLFSDNPFNSGLLFKLFFFGSFLVLLLICAYKCIKKNTNPRRIVFNFVVLLALHIVGLLMTVGTAFTNITTISGRSLTAFTIYELVVIILLLKELEDLNLKLIKSITVILLMVIVFFNLTKLGSNAIDTQRLNNYEANLANRIVVALEQMEDFDPNAKIISVGTPKSVESISRTQFCSYNQFGISGFMCNFLYNEVSGYNFQKIQDEDIQVVNENLTSMGVYPEEDSIRYVNGIYIIKLGQ